MTDEFLKKRKTAEMTELQITIFSQTCQSWSFKSAGGVTGRELTGDTWALTCRRPPVSCPLALGPSSFSPGALALSSGSSLAGQPEAYGLPREGALG